MPARNWTPEQRARQAIAIRAWKPWEQSTGPRTDVGKARASRNREDGGQRVQLRAIGRALREQSAALRRLAGGAQ